MTQEIKSLPLNIHVNLNFMRKSEITLNQSLQKTFHCQLQIIYLIASNYLLEVMDVCILQTEPYLNFQLPQKNYDSQWPGYMTYPHSTSTLELHQNQGMFLSFATPNTNEQISP